MTEKQALELAHFLPYLLSNLGDKVSQSFARQYQQEFDLTIAQWRVIANLAQVKQGTAKQLCDLANMDKSTASRAVKQLLARELICAKQDKQDKRATALSFTQKGLDLYQAIVPKALKWERELLETLSKEEQIVLLNCIEKLTKKALI